MNYTIKVWLFTLVSSPLLLIVVSDVFRINSKFDLVLDSWIMFFFMLLFGFFLSIPAMILFWIIELELSRKITKIKLKLILSIYSFASVWITFYILDKGFIKSCIQQLLWGIIYSLTIVLGVWLFKNPKYIKGK